MVQALTNGISTDRRQMVQIVAADKPSGKMFVWVLNTVHVSMRYESALVRSKSPGSVMLRRLMSKFTGVPSALSERLFFSTTALSRSWCVSVGTGRGSSMRFETWDGQFVRSVGDC